MIKENYWTEIRNDYECEIENGFKAICIDAWKTGDENEEGKVIAKVYGKWIADEAHIFVDYMDPVARTDKWAQESIEEAKKGLVDLLTPLPKFVRILKASNKDFWYADKLDKVYKVIGPLENSQKGYVVDYRGKAEVLTTDVEKINEFTYETWDYTDSEILLIVANIKPEDMELFKYDFYSQYPKEIPDDYYEMDDFLKFLVEEKGYEVKVFYRPENALHLYR